MGLTAVCAPVPHLQGVKTAWSAGHRLPPPEGTAEAALPPAPVCQINLGTVRRECSISSLRFIFLCIFSWLPRVLTKMRAQQLRGQVEGWPGRCHRPLHGGPARCLGCACRTSELTPVLPAVPGWLPVRDADCWPGPEATLGLSTGPGMGSRD